MKIRAEIKGPQGKSEEIWQMRMDPPFGFELQVLEGPSKGSKQAHTYVPMGDKTKVIVVGDFHRQGASDEDVRRAPSRTSSRCSPKTTRPWKTSDRRSLPAARGSLEEGDHLGVVSVHSEVHGRLSRFRLRSRVCAGDWIS